MNRGTLTLRAGSSWWRCRAEPPSGRRGAIPEPCTLHPAPCILHPKPCTLYPDLLPPPYLGQIRGGRGLHRYLAHEKCAVVPRRART